MNIQKPETLAPSQKERADNTVYSGWQSVELGHLFKSVHMTEQFADSDIPKTAIRLSGITPDSVKKTVGHYIKDASRTLHVTLNEELLLSCKALGINPDWISVSMYIDNTWRVEVCEKWSVHYTLKRTCGVLSAKDIIKVFDYVGVDCPEIYKGAIEMNNAR